MRFKITDMTGAIIGDLSGIGSEHFVFNASAIRWEKPATVLKVNEGMVGTLYNDTYHGEKFLAYRLSDELPSTIVPGFHSVFGPGPVAVISSDYPRYPAAFQGHETLGYCIRGMGLSCQSTTGRYGKPERSWIVYGATIEQLQQLGRWFGQESIAVRMNNRNFFLYTNGAGSAPGREWISRPAEGFRTFEKEPDDYFTAIPGTEGVPQGYFQWTIDFDHVILLSELRA